MNIELAEHRTSNVQHRTSNEKKIGKKIGRSEGEKVG